MDYGSRESSSGYSSVPPRRSEIQRTGSYRNMSAEIEQVVTKLLRTTKSLLEALNLWSQLRMSTSDIFELHRTLENQFYMVTQSFEEAHVKTSDLSWIPHQLRQSVVECMDQEPSTATLDKYLPRIRDVIVHLLHGLKGKQQQLREMDTQTAQMPSPVPPPLTQRDSYRSQDHYHRNTDSYSRSSISLTHSDSTGSNKSGRAYYSQQDRTSPTPLPGTPDRMTQSDYDPYAGGMPRPSVSSDSRKFYGQGSTPSSPKQQQQQQPRKPYYTSVTSVPSQQPFPSRSASRTSTSSRSAAAPASSNHLQPPSKFNNNDFDESDPHTASALAALKRQENLARRSSVRRASMYRGNTSADYASKRYLSDAPPVPSLQHNSTMDRVDENQPSETDSGPTTSTPSSGDSCADNVSDTTNKNPTTATSLSDNAAPSSLTLYLQMDQQTKKVSYSGEITLPALSMLFIERFGYSAGQQDFPTIYIRDPTLPNVSYELQDLSDVTDKSILSFSLQGEKDEKSKEWMEPMMKEWNETRRTMLEQMERLEQKMTERSSETETLVQQVVRQTLASTASQQSEQVAAAPLDDETKDDSKSETQTSAGSQMDTSKVTTENGAASSDISITATEPVDLKLQQQQQDEIEKLQRQVMILRQAQSEQHEEHNKVVKELQDENQQLKELVDKKSDGDEVSSMAKATPSQARHYIEQGKEELLTSSDKITARLEDLQDAIDHLKLDVTQRKCRPSETQMEHCREERKALGDEIEAFGVYITKVKPIWKKTWEQELQTIVKEQQTLKEQEGLLLDMNDDLAALQEVFENLEKICAFQEKSRRQVREFHVAPPEDGFEGMTSVLKQVATIDVDHDRRLKALDMADRMRQRELANRTDDFEKELSTFVDNKKLKKTGGAMEIDRLRQEKDEAIRQQLFKEKQQQKQQQSKDDVEANEQVDDDATNPSEEKSDDGVDTTEPEAGTDDEGAKST
ncbi:actin interacting protein 3-domain-containing protein [Absidia repens]|uniref:Actin interacting protein 3-domain-containing protein n=1 Tax=Absidia repens TaxID=90262 RepID=A0A1X2IY07_9FUNG|nr:actin interacting protein 3-domain-containing protein [Absidia repens]